MAKAVTASRVVELEKQADEKQAGKMFKSAVRLLEDALRAARKTDASRDERLKLARKIVNFCEEGVTDLAREVKFLQDDMERRESASKEAKPSAPRPSEREEEREKPIIDIVATYGSEKASDTYFEQSAKALDFAIRLAKRNGLDSTAKRLSSEADRVCRDGMRVLSEEREHLKYVRDGWKMRVQNAEHDAPIEILNPDAAPRLVLGNPA